MERELPVVLALLLFPSAKTRAEALALLALEPPHLMMVLLVVGAKVTDCSPAVSIHSASQPTLPNRFAKEQTAPG